MIEASQLSDNQVNHFQTFGFARLNSRLSEGGFRELIEEYNAAMTTGTLRLPFNQAGERPAWVVPCMGAQTPKIVSLATHEHVLDLAEQLLGGPVICVQAAAYWRSQDTCWHSDNPSLDYEAVKLYINLDPVDGNSGALRVIPGSHRGPLYKGLVPASNSSVEDAFGVRAEELPAVALSSNGGDIWAFNLRLWHAVFGSGPKRRVIELSYYLDPERHHCPEYFRVR